MSDEEVVPIVPFEAWKLIMVHESTPAGPVVWASKTSTQIMIGDPASIPTINKSPDHFSLPRLIMTVEQARALAGALLEGANIEEGRQRVERTNAVTIVNPSGGGEPDGPPASA